MLTVLVEHSRIAFNAYALYGNGAIIVPALLAPFALYPGWVWALRRRGRALELALYVLGLHFGVGLISALEVLFFPQDGTLTLADAAPGFLYSGAIYVLPAAFLAAAALWVGRRTHGNALSVAIVIGLLLSAFLAVFLGAGLGILAGGGVAFAQRIPSRAVAIGAVLFVVIVVVGNLPFAAALMSPLP